MFNATSMTVEVEVTEVQICDGDIADIPQELFVHIILKFYKYQRDLYHSYDSEKISFSFLSLISVGILFTS